MHHRIVTETKPNQNPEQGKTKAPWQWSVLLCQLHWILEKQSVKQSLVSGSMTLGVLHSGSLLLSDTTSSASQAALSWVPLLPDILPQDVLSALEPVKHRLKTCGSHGCWVLCPQQESRLTHTPLSHLSSCHSHCAYYISGTHWTQSSQ